MTIEDCLLASERGNLARELALEWCRAAGPRCLGARRAPGTRGARARAGGRDPERAAHRTAPDGRARLRNLVVREGRRTGKLQVRIVTTDGELEAGALAAALARGARRAASAACCGRARAAWPRRPPAARPSWCGARPSCPSASASSTCASPPEAFFQTNTEMAELLYGIVGEYAALEGWERVYDLYSGIGTIALTLAPRAGELWGIELVRARRSPTRSPERGATRSPTPASSPATRALRCPSCSQRAGRPDVARRRPSARRACPRRSCTASSTPRPSGSSTSPATPPRSPPMPPNSSRPAGRCAGCAPWTCSRRRTTSSASPCSSAGRLRRDARRNHPRQGHCGRAAPRPAAGQRRGARARARRRSERRRHDAAPGAVSGAARVAAGHPRDGARRRDRSARPRCRTLRRRRRA